MVTAGPGSSGAGAPAAQDDLELLARVRVDRVGELVQRATHVIELALQRPTALHGEQAGVISRYS